MGRDEKNKRGSNVFFSNGDKIDESVIRDILSFMEHESCRIAWQPGQFIIIDNSVAFHSRTPFTGKRINYASIANGTKEIPSK
jgi:hypothetical protein